MKFVTRYFRIIVVIALLFSCNNNPGKKPEEGSPDALTAWEIDERLKTADSLVVIFYKDPYGEDSLRYTRFYTQTSVVDSKDLEVLQQDLKQTFQKEEKRRICRGEGKIWCFTKGRIFQTLYFSTRCEDCCYLYLIKDGNFYYSRISSSMISWLADLKSVAIEPGNYRDTEE